MRRAYVCPKCANPVMRGSHCACFHTKHTIVGAAKTKTVKTAVASPPLSSVVYRWLGWSKRSRRRQSMEPQRVARLPEHLPDFTLEEMSRSSVMLDCFCAYVVLPCLGVLTVLSTVFIIVTVLDLFLWEMLEIMSFPIL